VELQEIVPDGFPDDRGVVGSGRRRGTAGEVQGGDLEVQRNEGVVVLERYHLT